MAARNRNDLSYLIGVDGGGTGCRIAIADIDGRVIGRASGEAANPATSMNGAIAALADALKDARLQAQLGESAFESSFAHLGLAGVLSSAIARKVAEALPFRKCQVTDDRPTSVAGALGNRDGALAVIGTGSFIGRQTGGKCRFAGGWGHHLGDEASGAWLGKRLLATALLTEDDLAAPSPLTESVLWEFGAASEAVLFAKDAQPRELAAFAPRIADAADGGDAVAAALMREGADYIERALAAVGRKPGEPLCLMGNLGLRYADYLRPDLADSVSMPAGTAVDGALSLAARMAETGG